MDIQKSANLFVDEVRTLLPRYTADYVLNTDKSGLEFEINSSRTLSYHGDKITLATVRSKNASTHSYTVQLMISLSDKLVGPVLLCLTEPTGKMSDNIKNNLFKADNVVVTCSASRKLTTSLVQYWSENVLVPPIASSSRILLLSDSWSGQANEKGIHENVKGWKRMEIQPKTKEKFNLLMFSSSTSTRSLRVVFMIEGFSTTLIFKCINKIILSDSIRSSISKCQLLYMNR